MTGENRRSALEIQDLKKKIIDLKSQGVPNRLIMEETKLPVKTYYRYLHGLCEEFFQTEISDYKEIIHASLLRQEKRMIAANKKYAETGEREFLSLAQSIETDLNKFLIEIGILPKAAENINIKAVVAHTSLDDLIEGMHADRKRGLDAIDAGKTK